MPTGFQLDSSVFLAPDFVNAGISRERILRTYEVLLPEVRRQPGVLAAAWIRMKPVTGALDTLAVQVPGTTFFRFNASSLATGSGKPRLARSHRLVGDAKYANNREAAPPTQYLPYWRSGARPGMNLAVRCHGAAASVIGSVEALFQVAPLLECL